MQDNTKQPESNVTTAVSNNKRIAKNTIALYFRMILLMIISLYTSRIVLGTLGVVDYGIYNAVGGLVAMFSILSGSLSMSISRYITFELGKGDKEKLKKIFCTSVNVQWGLAFAVLIIAEIAGWWFLNNKMNIPAERMTAANWVLHCSIMVFVVNLISIPYNAAIIAHEKMQTFAYISILEAILKLLIVYALLVSPFDKLILYSFLMLGVAFLIRLIYGVYCKRQFEECTYHFINDKSLLKEMTSFAGWGFFGNLAQILNTQGLNILINVFFGVTLNAARGIANQVEMAVQQFANNFTVALNPQITKSYASGDYRYMHSLVFRGAKLSYFLMLIFAIPICLEAETILHIWLTVVPDYSVLFIRWNFVNAMCVVLGNTLVTAVFATGDIKRYQIIVTSWGLLVFILSYVAFKLGYSVESSYIIYFVVYFTLLFIKLQIVKKQIKMSGWLFVKEVVLRPLLVTALSLVLPFLVCYYQSPSFLRLIETCVVGFISTSFFVYVFGLTTVERTSVLEMIMKKINAVRGKN